MSKLLLHACCAVCASYSILKLKEDGYNPIVYFYNPNIYPENEYKLRLNELFSYCKKVGVDLIVENYTPEDFQYISYDLENCPEKGDRCLECFRLRMFKTARKAVELGINKFTTTLTISPHKRSNMIFEAGDAAAMPFGLEFLHYDFKKNDGFKIAMKIAAENNMYKQTYCGCFYSIRSSRDLQSV